MKENRTKKPIRFGMAGASQIAHRMAQAMKAHPDVEIKAVFSRNSDKARDFAKQYGIPCFTSDLDMLLSHPDIDAVYIALPHGLHFPAALKALSEKKAVLCEKPAVLSLEEMQQIAQASQDQQVLFMEAMKTRFMPAYKVIKEMVQSGCLGKLLQIRLSLCYDFKQALYDASRYYNQPLQGGCLLDSGCYELNYLLDLLGPFTAACSIQAIKHQNIEHYVNLILDFDGTSVLLENAIDRNLDKTAVITGTKGSLVIEDLHRPERFVLCKTNENRSYEFKVDINDMYPELDAFCSSYFAGDLENSTMSHSDSMRQIELLTRLKALL